MNEEHGANKKPLKTGQLAYQPDDTSGMPLICFICMFCTIHGLTGKTKHKI